MAGEFIVSLLLFVSQLDIVDPHVLRLEWRNGDFEEAAATNEAVCNKAGQTAGAWLWKLQGYDEPPIKYQCRHENAFTPGWDIIGGKKKK